MTAFGILPGIAVAIAIGAMSPGPSFVLVSRISVANTRLHGLAAAIGMGLGGALFAVLALAGLIALLERVEWLYLVLKVAGGLYLVYLGVMIWRGAAAPISVGSAEGRSMQSLPRSLALGFVFGPMETSQALSTSQRAKDSCGLEPWFRCAEPSTSLSLNSTDLSRSDPSKSARMKSSGSHSIIAPSPAIPIKGIGIDATSISA